MVPLYCHHTLQEPWRQRSSPRGPHSPPKALCSRSSGTTRWRNALIWDRGAMARRGGDQNYPQCQPQNALILALKARTGTQHSATGVRDTTATDDTFRPPRITHACATSVTDTTVTDDTFRSLPVTHACALRVRETTVTDDTFAHPQSPMRVTGVTDTTVTDDAGSWVAERVRAMPSTTPHRGRARVNG
jgi:hypothetical protein